MKNYFTLFIFGFLFSNSSFGQTHLYQYNIKGVKMSLRHFDSLANSNYAIAKQNELAINKLTTQTNNITNNLKLHLQKLNVLNASLDTTNPSNTKTINSRQNIISEKKGLLETLKMDSLNLIQLQYIMDSTKQAITTITTPKPTLKLFRDSLKNTSNTDTTTLLRLNNNIDTIKLMNTMNFLSLYKSSVHYSIFKIGTYNTTILNNYLYNEHKFDFAGSLSLQNQGNSQFINAELVSVLFGPVRLGFGGSFKTTGDTTKDNGIATNLQKIVSNGGTINTNFTMPLAFWRSRNENMHFGIIAQSNWGINPNLSDSGATLTLFSNNINFVNEDGLLFHFDAGGNNNDTGSKKVTAKLSIDLPMFYAWGNANNQVNLPDFSVIQLRVGLIISNLVSLQISGPLYSTSKAVMNTPFSLYLQFSPSAVTKAMAN